MMGTRREMVTLQCLHILEFKYGTGRTKAGDILWCYRCVKYQPVKYVGEDWRARCTQCRYSRSGGTSRQLTENKARKHANITGHSVIILHQGEKVGICQHDSLTLMETS